MITFTKVIKTDVTFKTFAKILTEGIGVTHVSPRENALCMLSDLLKVYRYEVFKSFEGFKIVLNGYRQFKCIEFADGRRMKSQEVLRRLEPLTE